jgi:hypothetical protein
MVIAGRYSLDREVGRGGMGAVWLGRDEVLGRSVALKRIGMMPGAADPDLERAGREARLAAMLNHPHVVAVFDLVEEEDQHWLVMEYIDGQSLAQLVRDNGPLPPEQATRLLWQVADALSAAHGAGIVHRDVKPSNILVTDSGQAKLTDFGIARAQADASLTQTGLVTGSPAYLAPEVASGSTADSASDVWSLGATLFHCLAGRAPYDVGENLVGGLYKIVHEEPPRLPGHGALGGLLEVTMAKDPARRWTMEQVRERLGELAQDPSATSVLAPGVAPGAHHSDTAVLPAVGGVGFDTGAGRPAPPADGTAGRPAPPADGTAERPVPPADGTAGRPARRADGTEPRHRRRPPWLWIGGVAALLLVVLFLALALGGEDPQPTAGEDQASGSATGGGRSSSPSSAPSGSPSDTGNDAADTRAEMEGFIGDYLGAVTADRQAAFAMLTPGFQAASGGFEGYDGFWSTVADAQPLDVQANAETLQVSYTVRYRMAEGGTQTDDVTLQLVRQDDTYLIDGEG